MAQIAIERSHTLSIDDAKAAVQEAADSLARKYGLESAWDGDTLRFQRAGVDGALAVTPDQIAIKVELGMMFAPFKGMLESEILRSVDEAIGGSSSTTDNLA